MIAAVGSCRELVRRERKHLLELRREVGRLTGEEVGEEAKGEDVDVMDEGKLVEEGEALQLGILAASEQLGRAREEAAVARPFDQDVKEWGGLLKEEY